MKRKVLLVCLVILMVSGTSFGQQDTLMKSPSAICAGIGVFNAFDYPDLAAHVELEFFSPWRAWVFYPYGGLSISGGSSLYLCAGLTLPIRFARHFLLRLGFAPGLYWSFDPRLDLGCALEFRSSIKLSYVLKNQSSLGIQLSHISNAGLGNKNPGTEVLVISYEVPLRIRASKE